MNCFTTPTTAGKDRYLSEATALIDGMKGKLDDIFITKPKAELNVKALEAFYQSPSEDITRPVFL